MPAITHTMVIFWSWSDNPLNAVISPDQGDVDLTNDKIRQRILKSLD